MPKRRDAIRMTDEEMWAFIEEQKSLQVATIGIGIGRRHVLNAEGHTSYVAVDDVGKLAQALQAAVAENASFDPITAFEGGN